MLVRNHNLGRLDRFAVLIADRDLAFGVRAQRVLGAAMPRVRDVAQDLVGIVKRRRHQLRRLPAGITEHDALTAGALVLVAGRVYALRNIGGLGVQQNFDLGVAPVEPVLLVADGFDRLTRRILDLLGGKARSADLSRNDYAVGRSQSLASDANLVGIDACFR